LLLGGAAAVGGIAAAASGSGGGGGFLIVYESNKNRLDNNGDGVMATADGDYLSSSHKKSQQISWLYF
jgi:hypothetical protein